MGVDLDFAEIVIRYRKGGIAAPRDIKLEIAIPCKNQTRGWSKEDKERYQRIVDSADVVRYVNRKYFNGGTLKRNEYIVDKADCIHAFWNRIK